MSHRYLEVTYRDGSAIAAYLYLTASGDHRVERTEAASEGLLIDYSASDDAIGIEITAPRTVDADRLNDILKTLDQPLLTKAELAPLAA